MLRSSTGRLPLGTERYSPTAAAYCTWWHHSACLHVTHSRSRWKRSLHGSSGLAPRPTQRITRATRRSTGLARWPLSGRCARCSPMAPRSTRSTTTGARRCISCSGPPAPTATLSGCRLPPTAPTATHPPHSAPSTPLAPPTRATLRSGRRHRPPARPHARGGRRPKHRAQARRAAPI